MAFIDIFEELCKDLHQEMKALLCLLENILLLKISQDFTWREYGLYEEKSITKYTGWATKNKKRNKNENTKIQWNNFPLLDL